MTLRIAHWLEQLDPLECSCGLLTVHHLWRNAHVTSITVQLRLFYCVFGVYIGESQANDWRSQTSPDWIVCMQNSVHSAVRWFSASPCNCSGYSISSFIWKYYCMHFGQLHLSVDLLSLVVTCMPLAIIDCNAVLIGCFMF